jgi:hypothetical protein
MNDPRITEIQDDAKVIKQARSIAKYTGTKTDGSYDTSVYDNIIFTVPTGELWYVLQYSVYAYPGYPSRYLSILIGQDGGAYDSAPLIPSLDISAKRWVAVNRPFFLPEDYCIRVHVNSSSGTGLLSAIQYLKYDMP